MLFLRVFNLRSTERARVLLKNDTGIFKIALRLSDRHIFMWQSVKISNVFNTLTLKHIFWKTKTIFKKLEYHFLVETTKIENISFSFETALSEANVKTSKIEWRLKNGPITKSGVLPVNTLFFWKIYSSFRTSRTLIWWPTAQMLIFTFFVSAEVKL